MVSMAAVGDREKSPGFCGLLLRAVRYGVAAAVTVVILTVAVTAIKVVLRPNSLSLSVVGGSVLVTRRPGPPALDLRFYLRARNPSGRARMYYLNVTAYLFGSAALAASTASPGDDCLIFVNPPDVSVPQMQFVDDVQVVNASRDPYLITTSFFDRLYNRPGGKVSGVTMRVDGVLVTEIRSGLNVTAPCPTTYYCRELVVGDEMALINTVTQDEAPCTTSA